jgi:hypothetical protein
MGRGTMAARSTAATFEVANQCAKAGYLLANSSNINPGIKKVEEAAARAPEPSSSPVGYISPREVVGKTPEQIDARARELGLVPRGPDPARGRGAYIDPQTGKQRILCHPNANPPHGHVNNPAGERINIHGDVVEPETPEAHLPLGDLK